MRRTFLKTSQPEEEEKPARKKDTPKKKTEMITVIINLPKFQHQLLKNIEKFSEMQHFDIDATNGVIDSQVEVVSREPTASFRSFMRCTANRLRSKSNIEKKLVLKAEAKENLDI